MSYSLLAFCLLVTFVSFFVTQGVRVYAIRKNLLDHPNYRSSHQVPTPKSGGIGFVLIILVFLTYQFVTAAMPYEAIYSLMLVTLGIAIIGFIDDVFHMSASIRFVLYLVVIVSALTILPELPSISLYFVAIEHPGLLLVLYSVALLWFLNLFNFMDGIDGIAGSESILVLLSVSILMMLGSATSDAGMINSHFDYLNLTLWVIIAAVAGFLICNWPPASIFMGDVGSSTLGAVIGVLMVISSATSLISIWEWVIVTSAFWVDATVTLVTRMRRGEKAWEAHRSHAYQILSRKWKSHKKVTLLYAVINIFWLLPIASLSLFYSNLAIIFAILAAVPLVCLAMHIGAGTTNN